MPLPPDPDPTRPVVFSTMRVDWKETIDVVYLRHTLAPFGIYIHQVNDGTEDICLVFSTEPLHAVHAKAVWDVS